MKVEMVKKQSLNRALWILLRLAGAMCVLVVLSTPLLAGALKGDNREPWRRFFTRTTTNLVRDQAINADIGNPPNAGDSKEAAKKALTIKFPGLDDEQGRLKRLDAVGLLPIAPLKKAEEGGIAWKNVLKDSFYFLTVQHSFRFLTEPATRADLKGPVFADWFRSVRNLRGWRDGDPFLVNYIGHPMQGAVSGYILIQNDPKGAKRQVVDGGAYWRSRFKALGWTLAYSLQFEIGPLSESSLGNVGLRPVATSQHPQAWVDLVITPTLGTLWLVGEDAVDYFIVRRLESWIRNPVGRILLRSFLNPGRGFANTMRGKYYWHRDSRPGASRY